MPPESPSTTQSGGIQPASEFPTMAPQSYPSAGSAPLMPVSSDLDLEAGLRSKLTIAPPDIDDAKTLNRYLMKNFHARGGMGEVWLSHDPHIGREVAIKRLSASGGGATERFISEAQITGQLEHPCIVPVHDMGEDESGQPYYVMKFVRGKSLKQTIVGYRADHSADPAVGELQRAHLLSVFVGICQAVAYAHSRGVLHRDIKPDNIMLGEYGEIVLLDWGLAKVSGQPEIVSGPTYSQVRTVSDSLPDTEAGSVLGSPLYMPPEMAEGKIPDTDERTDIYLLGATLYEILTGRPPREGRSRRELIDLARTTAPVPPSKLCKVDKPIEAICLKAMSRRKEDRYPHAGELLDDVNRYLVGEPVSAWREDWLTRTLRWCKRHQLLLQRTAAIFFLLGTATFVLAKWRQLDQRQRQSQLRAAELQQREQARQQIQSFDKALDEARFYAASTDPVAEHAPYFDPDKARIAEESALAQSAGWGDGLDQLPLPQEAPRLRSRLYELLLLMAQSKLSTPDVSDGQNALALLDRAARLNPTPSRGYYRLRGMSLHQLNDAAAPAQAALELDPNTPSTAFDFFLAGEDLRRRAVSSDEAAYNGLEASSERTPRIQQAIDQYHRALELDPTLYWAHFQLGRCYLSLGKTSEAVEALGTCVALRPDAPWSYSARGMALGLLGRFDEAMVDLNHALKLNPDFLPAMLNRGAVRWLQNDLKGALADFSRILQAPSDRRITEAAFYRAQIYMQSGDLDDALEDLNTVIAAQPGFSGAMLLRGRVQLLKGNTSACLADLNRWLQNSRGSGATPQNLALLQRAELLRAIAVGVPPSAAGAALELARQDVESALRLGDHSSRVYEDQGAILDLLGDESGALSAYSLSLEADPRNNKSQINRAWAYQKAGKFPESADDFKAVISRDPASAEAHVGLAYVEACQNQATVARDEASQALLAGSADYLILHNAACVYAQLADQEPSRATQNQDVAIAMLQKAIELWKLNAKGPDELQLIDQEPAFTALLRARPEFKQLLAAHK